MDFTVGARFKRDGRKTEGREINAYLDAWPEDAAKPRVGGFREAIEKDGILVAPRQRMPELIELAKYVVIDDGLRGYQIWDRVFWDDGSGARKTKRPELTTFAQKYGPDKDKLFEFERQILSDKIFSSSNPQSPIPNPQSPFPNPCSSANSGALSSPARWLGGGRWAAPRMRSPWAFGSRA